MIRVRIGFVIAALAVGSSYGYAGQITVAVIESGTFGVTDADAESFWSGLTDAFASNLRFQVVERSQLETVIDELALTLSDLTSTETAVDVGRLVGSEYVVISSISLTGGVYVLSARMVNVNTGIAVASGLEKVSAADLSESTRNLAREIAAAIPTGGEVLGITRDGEVIVNIGSADGVLPGMKVIVYRSGEPIIDPDSGRELGKESIDVAELEVIEVQLYGANSKILKEYYPVREGDRVEADVEGFYTEAAIEEAKKKKEEKPFISLNAGYLVRLDDFENLGVSFTTSMHTLSSGIRLGYRYSMFEFSLGWLSIIPTRLDIDTLPSQGVYTYDGYDADLAYLGGVNVGIGFVPVQNEKFNPRMGIEVVENLAGVASFDLRYIVYDEDNNTYYDVAYEKEFTERTSIGGNIGIGYRFGSALNNEIVIGATYYFYGTKMWNFPVGFRRYL
jgi:hypothetical protein